MSHGECVHTLINEPDKYLHIFKHVRVDVYATPSMCQFRVCVPSTSSMSLSSAMISRGVVRFALAEMVVPTGEDSLTYP